MSCNSETNTVRHVSTNTPTFTTKKATVSREIQSKIANRKEVTALCYEQNLSHDEWVHGPIKPNGTIEGFNNMEVSTTFKPQRTREVYFSSVDLPKLNLFHPRNRVTPLNAVTRCRGLVLSLYRSIPTVPSATNVKIKKQVCEDLQEKQRVAKRKWEEEKQQRKLVGEKMKMRNEDEDKKRLKIVTPSCSKQVDAPGESLIVSIPKWVVHRVPNKQIENCKSTNSDLNDTEGLVVPLEKVQQQPTLKQMDVATIVDWLLDEESTPSEFEKLSLSPNNDKDDISEMIDNINFDELSMFVQNAN